MPLDGTYEPSPWGPIADQVRTYEESGGREGTELEGKPCVILWTRGRKSAAVRKTPLMRVTDGERYAVVASMGGAPQHPVWYLNLGADPNASIQDGPNLGDYTARTVDGEEKAEWWKRAIEVWPAYDDYQAATDRSIPLVVLEPKP
ncbi:MAG TPA: nitroreductase family deazaflavin-dependent oxidoreductase [Acidimicrobiia bacterium]|nr:nitroreductase family deazaflavin-dependent oxidoreductase [Acidimicrobiia bacterium]